MQYDNDILAELCESFDLYEYVSQRYELKRTGSNTYAMNCILHTDKTPSLVFNTNTNTFHCFSCGIGSSPIDFLTRIEHLSFNDAIEKIKKTVGAENLNVKTCDALAFYRTARNAATKMLPKKASREILPYSYYDKFSKDTPQEWVDEGISSEVMKEYDIRIDNRTERIIYPIFDDSGNLISIKGRTRLKAYKELGVAKYKFFTKISTTDFFVGLPSNTDFIAESGSVIVFEGIKSGLKLTSMTGKRNWVAAETSSLTEEQIIILISMGIKEVTIAFDQDVKLDKIKKTTKKLCRFTNVYAIQDKNKLLKEKDSPVDEGLDVWNQLMKERIKL